MFAAAIQQTIQQVYRDIQNGEDPWVAIGDFSHDWFGNYVDQRKDLVAEPLELLPLESVTLEQQRPLRQWAAFCAASVEYLCLQAGMPVPAWVNDTQYSLTEEEAFYTSPLAYKQRVRDRLRLEAPGPFKQRNVFCSQRVYANKYQASPLLCMKAV
jgi:hypothetical protein